jgi:hypothetical protein
VNGRDRPGLLYRLTSALTELKLQISSAEDLHLRPARRRRVLCEGPLRPEDRRRPRLKSIRSRLLQALDPSSPAPAVAAPIEIEAAQ